MSATEEVLEQIPEAVVEDTVEVVSAVRHNPALLVTVALVAGGVGGFVGYKFAQKRLRLYYKAIADEEIAEAREYYSRPRIKASPEELAAAIPEKETEARAAFERYSGQVESPVETEEELLSDEEKTLYHKNSVPEKRSESTRVNAFEAAQASGNFNMEAEILNRTGERPYVITQEEYLQNERDWEQDNLTYYQGDDVLVDERDQPVPDEDGVVGNDNLTRFGHGSGDENIVYIRNESLECDFEITRSFGKYAEEVLGFDTSDELKHSHGGNRKFRIRDE